MRYLDAKTLRQALPMSAAIDAIEAVMLAAGEGDAEAPERIVQTIPRPGAADCIFVVMPGTWAERGAAAAKVVSNVPDNPAAGRATVQGVAILFDAATGSPRLIADASTLTTIRTGAVVGLASRYLSREDSRVIGIVGTGGIAADLVNGVASVRDIRRVAATDLERARADSFAERVPFATEVLDDPDEVASRADILITATSSLEPVVSADAIRAGTHINAVGNFSPTGREIDGETVAAATRYVDDLENAAAEAGELLLAAEEGLIPPGEEGIHGDLPGLVSGAAPARSGAEELTLFKTVGTALSDVAALVAAAERAEEKELGVVLG